MKEFNMNEQFKKIIFLLLLLQIFLPQIKSQDIHFSQFYMAPLVQNPAMSGALHDLQAGVNYKNQWNSITVPYSTTAASFDMKLNKRKIKKGFWASGLNFFSDKAGDSKMGTTQINLLVTYHVVINKMNTLGAGFFGGIAQRSISYNSLTWGNQFDGNSYNASVSSGEQAGTSAITFPDFGTGVLWSYNNSKGLKQVTDNHELTANAGFAVFHITQPKYSFYENDNERLFIKYVLHGNALFTFANSNLGIVPGFMFYKQGNASELYAGSLVRMKLKQNSKYTGSLKGSAFSLGAYLRAKDAVSLAMLFEFSQYAIGISYDVNTSKLKSVSNLRGGFEISLRFISPNPFTGKSNARFL